MKNSFAKILHCSRPFCFIFAFVHSQKMRKFVSICFAKILRKNNAKISWENSKISQKNGNYAKLTKISRKIQNFQKQMQNQTFSIVKEEKLFIWHNFAETFSRTFFAFPRNFRISHYFLFRYVFASFIFAKKFAKCDRKFSHFFRETFRSLETLGTIYVNRTWNT